jgi:hypothetical protein
MDQRIENRAEIELRSGKGGWCGLLDFCYISPARGDERELDRRLVKGPPWRTMLLIISAVLAILPILGILWFVVSGNITTVDGLFMSLILLTISGIFALHAGWEFERQRRRAKFVKQARAAGLFPLTAATNGAQILRGRVESVEFYEAHVGQPNKSVVTLWTGGDSKMIILEGDMRNRLPAGKKVELICRDENGVKTLVSADYS